MNFALNQSLLICIDMQERLLPVMAENKELIATTKTLFEAARLLDLPLLITEQYPKGLGATSQDLLNAYKNPHIQVATQEKSTTLTKTTFSIFGDEGIRNFIAKSGAKELIICGIEAHICVLQSVKDALESQFKCTLVADSVSSRNVNHRYLALEAMRNMGALVLPLESVLFALMKDCKNAHFKAISAMIK